MSSIVLTGGGTAGHVTPNLALIPALEDAGFCVEYIGSENGIEKSLIQKAGIPYHGIATGKLRRYMSVKNFTDVFRVISGIGQAKRLLKRLKPDVVFSKGGFVAVPVVLAAKYLSIPVVVHESDITPGLANKIAIPFAKKVCTTFPETISYIPKDKGVNTGAPIRRELFLGDAKKGLEFCSFTNDKPVILMMGGSLGSVKINVQLRAALASILRDFQVVHICGKGNLAEKYENLKGYRQFEYIHEELSHVLACADVVISRAGSNSISEFLALKKPNLLIPLSQNASRGDQILNAISFENQGFSKVLLEEDMTFASLDKAVREVYRNRDKYKLDMEKSCLSDGVSGVIEQILNCKR